MAQTKHQIQALLAESGSRPRHRFGQNFMIDANIVRLIAEAGQIVPGDLVIEIGPGTGTLTEEILGAGARVVAVEIDRDLAQMLRIRFGGRAEFSLIEGDALAGKHSINAELAEIIVRERPSPQPSPRVPGEGVRAVKLVANLPYNIASPLIIELLIAGVDVLVFTVQKEVADRLRAGASSEHYGPLSIMAQMLARVEMLRVLPPQVFWPMPKIESALLRLVRDDRLGEIARPFGVFVHAIFSSRRKTLRKSLLQAGADSDRLLAETGIAPQIRPEELTPEQCLELFTAQRKVGRDGVGSEA